MIWVVLGLQVLVCWWLYDIRRALGLRARPRLLAPTPAPAKDRTAFPGAVPPNRYVVVRWPQQRLEYAGCAGGRAREVFEAAHPAPGEDVEFWELGSRRGIKEG